MTLSALGSDGTARQAVACARSWIGTPYVHQASRKRVGCDCLGLLRGVWRELYGAEPEQVPDYTADWDLALGDDVLLTAARRHLFPSGKMVIGNVVIFRWRPHLPAKHLAIISGARRMIHAYERAGVIESPLAAPWRKRIAGIFSFPPRSLPKTG